MTAIEGASERRPGARIEEKLPGIGPALDKLAPKRLEQADRAVDALPEPEAVEFVALPEPEPEPEPPKERERNLRPGVARSVDAAADAVDARRHALRRPQGGRCEGHLEQQRLQVRVEHEVAAVGATTV